MSNAIIIPTPFLALSAVATSNPRGRATTPTYGSGARAFLGARA